MPISLRNFLSPEGESALARTLQQQPLLAFDFDGTLSPIVDDPSAATLVAGAARVLVELAAQVADAQQTLDFNLDEVREARLVPVVDFKGRRTLGDDADDAGAHAGRVADEMDGGQD